MNRRYKSVMEKLGTGGAVLLDGGVSTELENRGAAMKSGLWSGHASLDSWDLLVDVHLAYIDAGAEVITANTYASSRLMLEPLGHGDRLHEINMRSMEAAQEARKRCGKDDILIAGSLSHVMPFTEGVEGATQQPDLSYDHLRGAYDELIGIHEEGGADVLLLEMMSIPGRMAPLFDAAKASALPAWCGLSAKGGKGVPLTSWHDPTVSFETTAKMAADAAFDAIGIMHTSAEIISECIAVIRTVFPGPVMAYPDSGFFQAPHWQFVDIMSPETLKTFGQEWLQQGAQILGGCCGLSPPHIAALQPLIKPTRP